VGGGTSQDSGGAKTTGPWGGQMVSASDLVRGFTTAEKRGGQVVSGGGKWPGSGSKGGGSLVPQGESKRGAAKKRSPAFHGPDWGQHRAGGDKPRRRVGRGESFEGGGGKPKQGGRGPLGGARVRLFDLIDDRKHGRMIRTHCRGGPPGAPTPRGGGRQGKREGWPKRNQKTVPK